MSDVVYKPGSDLVAKLKRRAARYVAKDMITPSLKRGIISLSFDDCPRSVVENALPLIEAKGWRATIYASMGLCNTTNHLGLHMSEADMVAAHKAGHEIGDHTFSHMDGLQAGPDAFGQDIDRNQARFAALDLPPAKTFAYPYGEVTPALKRRLHGRFDLARGIHDPSGNGIDLGLAAAGRLYSDAIEQTIEQIKDAVRERRWLILFGHDVRNNPSPFGCTPDELSRLLAAIEATDLTVLPVADALDEVRR
jgi:peptidoglycan/xylan/chitin deacetylase (PgdA/CDA1 family)